MSEQEIFRFKIDPIFLDAISAPGPSLLTDTTAYLQLAGNKKGP
jgi:hypothetical protein